MPPVLPVMSFASADEWARWLAEHHATAGGVWVRLPKNGVATPSMTRAEALDEALDLVRERWGPKAVTRALLLGRDEGWSPPLLPD